MATILDEIIAYKRHVVAEAKQRVSPEEIRKKAYRKRAPGSLTESLTAAEDIALIAEIKKASPSKGVIREDFDPVAIGRAYEKNGAAAISVLTDERYFQGSDASLSAVSEAVQLPILRKDFVVDPYQIHEARTIGADAILLIVSALSKRELPEMLAVCRELELDALVEVHTREEASMALDAGADLVGVNNRDLNTFETDLRTTFDLIEHLRGDPVVVSESGIETRDDVGRLQDAGVDAVLVGEHLMRRPDVGRKLRALLGKGGG
ncbi:MAG: indole-3-glycerol phosphate synthase TrpC [Gemmatimonadota bacterium]|nr:indole-3-glycerol phosphate synthase TrpC [Gemmatimonadota bacterium]